MELRGVKSLGHSINRFIRKRAELCANIYAKRSSPSNPTYFPSSNWPGKKFNAESLQFPRQNFPPSSSHFCHQLLNLPDKRERERERKCIDLTRNPWRFFRPVKNSNIFSFEVETTNSNYSTGDLLTLWSTLILRDLRASRSKKGNLRCSWNIFLVSLL